jgi:hypothetical protein
LLPPGLAACGVANSVDTTSPQKNQVVTILPQRDSSGTLPRKALFLSVTEDGRQLGSSDRFELMVRESLDSERDLLVLDDCAQNCPVSFDLARAGLFVLKSGGVERKVTGYRFVSEDANSLRVAVDFR